MAKSSKKSKNAGAGETVTAEPQDHVAPPASGNSAAAKPAKATKSSARKNFTDSPRRAVASDKPRKSAARKKSAVARNGISDEDIRLRAYFLAEKRAQQHLAGDSASDWLEARRQLLEESAARA